MLRKLTPVLLATVLLAGCSSTTVAESTPTPKATPTPTPTALAVSEGATCTMLFGTSMNGPVSNAADIVTRFAANPDLSTVTQDELQKTVDDLESAAEHASPELKPYIEAQSAPVDQLLTALKGGANSTVSFDNFKASGLELISRCTPYL